MCLHIRKDKIDKIEQCRLIVRTKTYVSEQHAIQTVSAATQDKRQEVIEPEQNRIETG